MHPVLEQIKQFLAPRWYKLQKSVVEFVKQFLVPKLRELQKYMVEFKERMTMKRMVVMCLLLVAVVCGILALAQGDGKQDWEKEPYPFEIENIENGFRYKTNLPVKASDNKKGSFDLERIIIMGTEGSGLGLGLQFPLQVNEALEAFGDYGRYLRLEFSNGQNLFLNWYPMNRAALWLVFLRDLYGNAPSVNTAMTAMDSEQQQVYIVSMLRSYDIKTVAYCRLGENRFKEVFKLKFDKFNSAATVNAMLNDAEKKLGSDEHFGKLLTKGSSSSKTSSAQSNKSISPEPDDDEEEIDSVLVEKSIVIKSVETQHNVVQNGQKGMNIIINYSVEGMKGKTGGLNAYFYFEDGTPLKDGNKSSVPYYGLDNGNVAVGKQFTPRYDDVAMSGTLFMPYDELHLRKGKFSLKYYCAIFDDDIKLQATSDWKYFTVTQQ